MAISAQTILASSVVAVDGPLGTIHDLMFDVDPWQVRYLQVDTGRRLRGRRVLLSPRVIEHGDWLNHELTVGLDHAKVEQSPPVDAALPSRADEIALARHYGWAEYWTDEPAGKQHSPHLASAREMLGAAVDAVDGPLGIIDDLIVDDDPGGHGTWEIRYLVVELRGWFQRKRVLVAPSWASSVQWDGRRLGLGLSGGQVRESPEFDPSEPVNRETEQRLYDYYGLPKSWA